MAAINIELIKELRTRTNAGMAECKKALDESNSNIDDAVDLLKQWGILKAAQNASKVASEGRTLAVIENNVGGIVQVNCETDFLSRTTEFENFTKNIVSALCRNTFTAKDFEEERLKLSAASGENVVISGYERFEKTSPLSLLTTYNHISSSKTSNAASISVLIETQAPTQSIFSSEEFRSFSFDIAMQIAATNPTSLDKDDISQEIKDRYYKIFETQLKEEGTKPIVIWDKIITGKFEKLYKEITLMGQDYIKEPNKSVSDVMKELSNKLGGNISISRFKRFALSE